MLLAKGFIREQLVAVLAFVRQLDCDGRRFFVHERFVLLQTFLVEIFLAAIFAVENIYRLVRYQMRAQAQLPRESLPAKFTPVTFPAFACHVMSCHSLNFLYVIIQIVARPTFLPTVLASKALSGLVTSEVFFQIVAAIRGMSANFAPVQFLGFRKHYFDVVTKVFAVLPALIPFAALAAGERQNSFVYLNMGLQVIASVGYMPAQFATIYSFQNTIWV